MNYNGTNYTFSEPVSDELICPICHCILEEPQQTNCGHLFCSKCLQSAESSRTSRVTSLWQIDEKSLECPLCRTVSPRGAFYDARTNRQIQNLQVVCTNAPCTWTGSLCELSNHRNGTKCEGCLYEAVTCPNDCQTTNILRKDLADHRKNVCPLREEACKHCRVMLQHCKMADHFMSSCQEYPIQCPNECGKTNIPLKNINAHILKCPESKMTCPYQKIGCSHTFPRKHLQTHMDEGKDHHLQLTLDQVSRLTDVVAHMYLWIDKHSDPNDPILRESFLQSPLLDHTKLHDRPWLKSESVFPSMPWIVKFDNFSQYSEKEWISCTFYTHPVGYKLRLRVTHGADSGVTIILDRLKGTNDDWLPALPSEDSITITLLNQLKNEFHFTLYMQTGQWETGLNFFVPYCELYNDIKKPKFLCDVSLFFLVAMAAPFPKEQQCKEPICEGERAPSLPLCQDKNIPSQSSYAASTKPNHLALAIDRIKISPREMDVIARPMCFLCLGKEPRDTPYGVFMCIIHAQEIHKTQIQRPRGMSLYTYTYHSTNLHTYVHIRVSLVNFMFHV